jgi:hypothetical protein
LEYHVVRRGSIACGAIYEGNPFANLKFLILFWNAIKRPFFGTKPRHLALRSDMPKQQIWASRSTEFQAPSVDEASGTSEFPDGNLDWFAGTE